MSSSDQLELVLRMLGAIVLGAVIGAEREFRGHEAGVRTSALICGGAALFGMVDAMFEGSRVAAGVVQGVGFLGAGVMFQRRGEARNVTTASTIWVLAGIGLAVAAKPWVIAIATTVMVVVLLEASDVSDAIRHVGKELERQPARRAASPPEAADRQAGDEAGSSGGPGGP